MKENIEIKNLYYLFDYFVDFGVHTFLLKAFSDFIPSENHIFTYTKHYRYLPKKQLPCLIWNKKLFDSENYDYSVLDFLPFPFTNFEKSGEQITVSFNIKEVQSDEELLKLTTFAMRTFKDLVYYAKNFPLPKEPFNLRLVYRKFSYDVIYATDIRDPSNKYGLYRFIYEVSSQTKHQILQKWSITKIPITENLVLIVDNYSIYLDLLSYKVNATYTKKEYPIYSVNITYDVWAPFLYPDVVQVIDRDIVIEKKRQT